MEVTCPGPYLQDRELKSSGCEQIGVGVGGGGESMGRTGPRDLTPWKEHCLTLLMGYFKGSHSA